MHLNIYQKHTNNLNDIRQDHIHSAPISPRDNNIDRNFNKKAEWQSGLKGFSNDSPKFI